MADADVPARRPTDEALDQPAEPPVVARLVIEIRSDGSRTIARGALEDLTSGERVALKADGRTPAELLGSLLGQLTVIPRMVARAALGRLGPRRK